MSPIQKVDYETILKNRSAWNERFEKEVAPIQ